jgi:hypothetical protein
MYEPRGPGFFQWPKPIRSCECFSEGVKDDTEDMRPQRTMDLVADIQNSTPPKTENEDKVRGQIRSKKGRSRRCLLTFDAEQIDHQDDQDDDSDNQGWI